jgi:hypothetical protein
LKFLFDLISPCTFVANFTITKKQYSKLGIMQDNYRRGSLPLKKRKVSLDSSLGFAAGDDLESSALGNLSQRLLARSNHHDACTGVSMSTSPYDGLTSLSIVANAAISELVGSARFFHGVEGEHLSHDSVGYADRISDVTSQNSNGEDEFSLDGSSGQELERKSANPSTKDSGNRIRIRSLNKRPKIFTSSLHVSGQDKRYSGTVGEMRCCATTTRGKACAYCCVNRTKYCHLHTDYETNPPPRRTSNKGKSTSACELDGDDSCGRGHYSIEKSLVRLDTKELQIVPISTAPSLEPNNISRLPSPFVDEKHKEKAKSRRTAASKLVAQHSDHDFPLLSMISTDQWFDKAVKITSGPLNGKCGTVEKWGNGWVSVKVPGIGLHNRRSFELCILSDQDDTSNDVEDNKTLVKSDENISLFRVVSRDGASPLLFHNSNSGAMSSENSLLRATGAQHSVSFTSFPESRLTYSGGFDDEFRSSPAMIRGLSVFSQAPHVTPLTSREMQPFVAGSLVESLKLPDDVRYEKCQ